MLFCPTCSNILAIEETQDNNATRAAPTKSVRFYCKTCPYIYQIEEKLTLKMTFPKKKVEDVLGGEDAWDCVDAIDQKCPKAPECKGMRAYFM